MISARQKDMIDRLTRVVDQGDISMIHTLQIALIVASVQGVLCAMWCTRFLHQASRGSRHGEAGVLLFLLTFIVSTVVAATIAIARLGVL